MTDVTAAMERLVAQDAIRRALVDYCRGVDRGDVARVLSAYHPDAVDHHGTWDGVAHEDLPAALDRLLARTTSTVHFLGASTFEWRGETAYVETSVHALHETVGGDGVRSLEHLFARYLDVFDRRDGEWRIADRTFVHDLDHLTVDAPHAYPPEAFVRGARGSADPATPDWEPAGGVR